MAFAFAVARWSFSYDVHLQRVCTPQWDRSDRPTIIDISSHHAPPEAAWGAPRNDQGLLKVLLVEPLSAG